MAKFSETLIDFLRFEGHRCDVDVKPSPHFTYSKVYFNRDPSGVLRGSALTVIQANEAVAYNGWVIAGSAVVPTEKGKIFILEATVVGKVGSGLNVLRLRGIRSLQYSIAEVETYYVNAGDDRCIAARTGKKMISMLKRIYVELSSQQVEELKEMAPICTGFDKSRMFVRYAPSYYHESEKFFASLPKAA